jgi:hypothetical protein
MQGVEDERGRAMCVGMLESLGDYRLCGDEVAQPVLVDLGHLLPWPRIEDARASGRRLPQLA